MKNILEILKGLNIEVPAEMEQEITKQVAENYKTIAEVEKKVGKLEKEVEEAKERANSAEETIKGFEGKDYDAMKADAEKWKADYEALIQKQKDDAENAELNDAINKAIKDSKGKDAKSIIAHLDIDSIKQSKNRDKDIVDAIKALSESEATSFLFNTEAEDNKAQFASPTTGQSVSTVKDDALRKAFGLPVNN